jgi:tRNA G46 methylase TrmB
MDNLKIKLKNIKNIELLADRMNGIFNYMIFKQEIAKIIVQNR